MLFHYVGQVYQISKMGTDKGLIAIVCVYIRHGYFLGMLVYVHISDRAKVNSFTKDFDLCMVCKWNLFSLQTL